MITSLFLSTINHLLSQSDWARQRLLSHAGRTARLDLSPWIIDFSISADGYLALWETGKDKSAEVVLKLSPGDLHQLLNGGADALMRQVHIEGNAEFADTLGFVFRHLKWDAAEDLSRITGDIAAQRLVNSTHQMAKIPHQLWENISGNLSEYLTEENPYILTQTHVNTFSHEIAEVRDAVARLEKRTARLN